MKLKLTEELWKEGNMYVELSKQADRFTEREGITDDEIFSMIEKFINYSKGLDVNIDVKRM